MVLFLPVFTSSVEMSSLLHISKNSFLESSFTKTSQPKIEEIKYKKFYTISKHNVDINKCNCNFKHLKVLIMWAEILIMTDQELEAETFTLMYQCSMSTTWAIQSQEFSQIDSYLCWGGGARQKLY